MQNFFREFFDGGLKLIRSVEFSDIVDILLVTVILYYVVKVLRQTRAFHLVKGIVLMGVIYLVVSSLNMNTSSYLFSQFFGDIVIVMILLFQPEIRQTLESFGRGDYKKLSLFFTKNSGMDEEATESVAANVAKAVANMSDKKVGALIVVEGKTPLGEILGTGSKVDAAVESVVLENIFFPKSPLHDGAVVIRDNRINAAGCILPLTQNEVSFDLGTRHRAALGMSEHSDSLVIVVSEETGSISVAAGGSLERAVSVGEVHEALIDFMKSDNSENNKSFRILRRKK